VAQPLVGGIYTADPAQLSLAATMPRFLEMERQHRSVIWAMWKQQRRVAAQGTGAVSGARWSLFVSFKHGMQTLVDQLTKRLPEGTVRVATAIGGLRRREDGKWLVGHDDPWDAVIVATPAPVAARLVTDAVPRLAAELAGIPYASTAIVNLIYRREDIPHPLNGFGFVVPAIERRNILACTFSSLKYEGRAPGEYVIVRSFVGGALQPELFRQDDAAMETSVRTELRQLLGITAEPRVRRIARYEASMPQYQVGHLDRRARIARLVEDTPRLALAGNAYQGVGIPDCVHSGEQAAEAIFAALVNPSSISVIR
jgi:oxygen-dependent protoporphyrinogen oxidase